MDLPCRYDAFVCVDFRDSNALDVPLVPVEADTYARNRVLPGVTSFVGENGEHGALLTFSPTAHRQLELNNRYDRDRAYTSILSRAPPPDSGISSNHKNGGDTSGKYDNEVDSLPPPTTILARVGVSLVSTAQACANAEQEVGTSSFEDIMNQSKALWQEKLSRIELDIANTPPNVTELFYSSFYRSFLTPVSNNEFLRHFLTHTS